MSYQRLWTSVAAIACAATLTAACGKKDKKDDAKAAPAPVEVTLSSKSDQSGTMIKYKSNIKDAKFKCMVEANGQAGQWQDCPADGLALTPEDGVVYVIKVKAIGPDGTESIVAEETIGEAGKGGEIEMATEILNKSQVPAVYNKTSLQLNFGVDIEMDVEDLRFECKRENEADFRRCPSDDAYDFGALIDGMSYSLTVRAVHRPTKTVAAEDTISFKVALSSVNVVNADKLRQDKSGSVQLSFPEAAAAGHRVNCSIDGAPSTDCTTGMLVALDPPTPAGSHALKIDVRDAAGGTVGSTIVNYCARQCDSGTSGPGAAGTPAIQAFQLGSFYEFLIPADMHVTEYATTKTYNTSLSFYRIMSGNGPNQDPYYIGNYGCYQDFDRKITAAAPNGTMFDYCHTTPQRDLYKWLTDFRLANNHIEVATNPDEVDQFNHEKIMINVFDDDYEFMVDRSRFEQLCMNVRGTIEKSPPIRFIDRGFWGEKVVAEFYMCVTNVLGGGPGGLPFTQPSPIPGNQWWIGAFFITSEGLDLPKFECFKYDYKYDLKHPGQYGYEPEWCGTFKNPSLLEVVYMTKTPFRTAADFARAAQSQFVRNLNELVPIDN